MSDKIIDEAMKEAMSDFSYPAGRIIVDRNGFTQENLLAAFEKISFKYENDIKELNTTGVGDFYLPDHLARLDLLTELINALK